MRHKIKLKPSEGDKNCYRYLTNFKWCIWVGAIEQWIQCVWV